MTNFKGFRFFLTTAVFAFFLVLFCFSAGHANAAVKTWNPAGCGSTSWNTAGNWSGGLPGTGDIATFDGATSNCNVTVDTTIDVAGINITGSYTGTITQGNGNDINIRASGYTQNASGSTFTGGDSTSDITFDSNGGDFSLTTGTFNAPAGTITVGDNWTTSGGTFNAGSGTVKFSGSADNAQTITGTNTFNKLNFDDACTNGSTYSIASGTTLTANNTLYLAHSCNGYSQISGPGGITAKADITTNDKGVGGTAVVTINGTVDQALNGTAAGGNKAYVPGITINKTSGTLTFTNDIWVLGDFTYTQGTVSPGTSRIIIDSLISNRTVTGSLTFNDLRFDDECTNGSTVTIASGTTLTINGILSMSHDCNGQLQLLGSGAISAKGNILSEYDGAQGAVVITINGTGNQTFTGDTTNGTAQVPAITINKTSGTLTLAGTTRVTDNWTYTAGTIDPGTSTIWFAPYFDQAGTVTGSMTFYNIEIGNPCVNSFTLTIASGTTIAARNNLTFENTCGFNGSVNGPGTISFEGSLTTLDDGAFGNVAITAAGSGNQTITLVNSTFPTGTFTINKPSGTVTLASAFPLTSSGQDLIIASGILNISTYNLTVNDTLTITSGQLNQTTGTLNVGGMSIAANGIWTNNSTGSIVIGSSGVSNSGYVHLDGGGPTCGNATGGTPTNSATFEQVKTDHSGAVSSQDVVFNSNNKSGGLIVVTIATDNAATPTVTDSRNSYQSAVGPTVGSFGREQTFYAYNIGAGANTVHISYSPSTTAYAIAYATEYSGMVSASDPKDTQAGNFGLGNTMDSGSSSTSNAYDLIYGAGIAEAAATGAGSGFTSRNTDFGNQTEDKQVTTTGSYNATVGNDGNNWIMQMVAFKALTAGGVVAPLAITSSSPGTARTWSGSGTFVLNDLDVSDQSGSMTAYNSNNNNSSSTWTFNSSCPAYSNRGIVSVSGGVTIQGGTTIRSN